MRLSIASFYAPPSWNVRNRSVSGKGQIAFYAGIGYNLRDSFLSAPPPGPGQVMQRGTAMMSDSIFQLTKNTLTAYHGPGGTVQIPSNVQSISNSVFKDNKDITVVRFPQGLQSIGASAFEGCTALKNVSFIGKSPKLEEICDSAFKGCMALKEITIPPSVQTLQQAAFQDCTALQRVRFQGSLEVIREHTFTGCSSLQDVSLPQGLTIIEEEAFMNCTALRHIALPFIMKEIGYQCFCGCTALEDFSIPECLEGMGNAILTKCTGLKTLIIPSSLTYLTEDCIAGCKGLEEIRVSPLNKQIQVEGLAVYEKNGTRLDCAPRASGRFVVPPRVTEIGAGAFSLCDELTEIVLPPNLKTISRRVFTACSNLSGEITVPDSVTSMGTGVFQQCPKLTKVTLPASIKNIPNWTFTFCTSLEEVVFKGSYFTYNEYSFYKQPENFRLVATRVPFRDIPPDLKLPAIRGFAKAYRAGETIDPEICETYLRQITQRRKELWKDDNCLRLLLDRKKIALDEISPLLEEATKAGQPEIAASLLEYRSSSFSERQIQRADLAAYNDAMGTGEMTAKKLRSMFRVEIMDNDYVIVAAKRTATSIEIPFKVNKRSVILYNDFAKNHLGLKEAIFQEGISCVPQLAFAGCANLERVVLPTTIRWLDGGCFMACISLKEVYIPDGCEKIETMAFLQCFSLERIRLPASIKFIGANAFNSCPALKEVLVPRNTPVAGLCRKMKLPVKYYE